MADSRWFPWLATTLVVVSMAGCSAGSAAETTSSEEPTASSEPPPFEPNPDPSPLPGTLTFSAGADLDPAVWRAGWHVEPVDLTNGYAIVHERDDWEEVNFDAQGCVSTRSHDFGPLEWLDDSLGDDAASDELISRAMGIPVEEFTEYVSDGTLPVVGRETTADFRILAGSSSDGGSWIIAARVFGALDTALVLRLDCEPGPMTGSDTQALYDRLAEVAGPDGMVVGMGRTDWNVVDELDFDAGDELSETSGAAWVDVPMTEDPSWLLDEGDPDDGTWAYDSADGDCRVEFEQSYLDEYARSLGDDRAASDELLAVWLGVRREEMTETAEDGGLGLGVPGNDLAAARVIEEEDGRGGTVTAARALVQPGFGFVMVVECRTTDPREAFARVVAKSAIQVVP